MTRARTHRDVDPEIDLTSRQRQVIELLAKGYTNSQIGESLGISLDGAKWHVSELIAKFDATSREEVVEFWRAHRSPVARLSRALRALAPAGLIQWAAIGAGGVAVAGATALAVTVAMGTFAADDRQALDAEEGEVAPVPVAALRTPYRGERPDSSRPAWFLPYTVAESLQPKLDGEVNGIVITHNPDGFERKSLCTEESDIQQVALEAVRGSPVDVNLTPVEAVAPDLGEMVLESTGALICGDSTASASEVRYTFVTDEEHSRLVSDGSLHIFDARRGGSLTIFRIRIEEPGLIVGHIPADRWQEVEIGGHPAAFAPPLFPEGFGESLLVVWDGDEQVMTVVWGSQFSADDLLRMGEAVIVGR